MDRPNDMMERIRWATKGYKSLSRGHWRMVGANVTLCGVTIPDDAADTFDNGRVTCSKCTAKHSPC